MASDAITLRNRPFAAAPLALRPPMRGNTPLRVVFFTRRAKSPPEGPPVVHHDDVDLELLEDYLKALSSASRLELLQILRFPRALQEIKLAPRQHRPGDNPDRPASRQAIQVHIDKLLEIGVLLEETLPGPAGRKEYVVNGPTLYRIMEEFRKIGTVAVGATGGRDETVEAQAPRALPALDGPTLVLAHGLLEGKAFPLRRVDLKPGRGFVIGRKPGLHVSLEYDPYVSLENSEVVLAGNDYTLLDLRSSKNGTWLNWRRLGPDERAVLKPGDVIGVGRSLLVFRLE